MPQCALCLEEGHELRLSHIYPKFTYRRMRDDDNGFLHLSTGRPGVRPRFEQDGFKERLLCDQCEQRFQRWEDYFARIVRHKRLFDHPRR